MSALLQQAAARVEELDLALERVGSAAYGVCETCGEPIPAERLAVRPSARACVRCADGRARR